MSIDNVPVTSHAEDESEARTDDGDHRAARAEQRLAVPVLVAAIASIPATFLTTLEGRPQQAGHIINYLSVAVLAGESIVPFVLASHRWTWLRERWYVVAVAAVSIPAVIFAVGPAQLFRLVRFVGALRVLRVRRILKAGKILRQRSGHTGWQWKLLSLSLSLLAAGFVAIVLSDPSSQTRQLAEGALGRFGLPAVILAGAIVAAATFLVLRYGRKSQD
ncbi:MAG: hypothetical protein WD602_03340 [Actinomycetota bacterium]